MQEFFAETFVISSTAILMIRNDVNFARCNIYFAVIKDTSKCNKMIN